MGGVVQAGMGSRAQPLDVSLTRAREGPLAPAAAGRAGLWLEVDATSSAVDAVLDLRVLEQTFAPGFTGGDRLHVEAHARFDAVAGRTDVTLEHTEVGDGAATTEAVLELPDAGDPVVRHAQGDIDLARLLQWVPAGLVPLTAERAKVRYQIESLVAGPIVHLSDGGAVALDAELSNVRVNLAAGALEIAAGHLKVHGQQAADGAVTGDAALSFSRMVQGMGQAGAAQGVAEGGNIELRVQGVHLDAVEPLATRGDLALSLDLASLDVRSSGVRGPWSTVLRCEPMRSSKAGLPTPPSSRRRCLDFACTAPAAPSSPTRPRASRSSSASSSPTSSARRRAAASCRRRSTSASCRRPSTLRRKSTRSTSPSRPARAA